MITKILPAFRYQHPRISIINARAYRALSVQIFVSNVLPWALKYLDKAYIGLYGTPQGRGLQLSETSTA